MQRSRLLLRSSLVSAAFALTACARDLPLEAEVNPADFTVAQFDPTNPVSVLQITPIPTALAENPDGTINRAAVVPEACELPTAAQCLQFANGWPTDLPLTLFFSQEPDAATLDDGVVVYEQVGSTLVAIETVKIWQDARDPIPEPCLTEFNIAPEQIPPGGQLLVLPAVDAIPSSTTTADFKPGTRYVVKVESYIDASGNVVGLRDQAGQPVEPAALFSILNVPNDPATVPVLEDGSITSGLLRTQVSGSVIAGLGLDAESLTPEEQMTVAAAVQDSGRRLYPLFLFFNGTVEALLATGGLAERTDAVLVNAWTTEGDSPTEIAFDPAAGILPFPNSQVLTRPDETTTTGVRVSLPVDPNASALEQGLITGLNTLAGFSTTASISFQSTRPIDESTLEDNVLMYVVDESDASMPMAVGDPIPLKFSTASAGPLTSVFFRSVQPLQQNTAHVVIVKNGVLDTDGNPVRPNATFNLLKSQDPIVDGGGVNPAFVPVLQCAQFQAGAPLEAPVDGLATQLEVDLARARWAESVAVAARQPVNIPPEDILMAFAYHTQDLSGTLDTVASTLLPTAWPMLETEPAVVGPVVQVVGTASIAETAQVVENLCVGACLAGAMQPRIAPAECLSDLAAVAADPQCDVAINLVAGNLARASLYLVEGYTATAGNPFSAGTFTPDTVQTPRVEDRQVWVIEPVGTPPEDGWPVAIFQHGLGQIKESGFYIAGSLAAAGFATVLIDMPYHGSRASDLTFTSTAAPGVEFPCTNDQGLPDINPATVACNPATGQCAGGCDGVQDSSGTGFLSTNLFGIRDNFQQTVIDHLALLQSLQDEGTATGAWPFLDGSTVGYVGQSLGSIAGANFAAYTMDLLAVVLNVGGGSLTTIIQNTVPTISAGIFAALNQAGICDFNVPQDPTSGCQDTPAFRQFIATAQWALDPGDPLANSVHVVSGLGVDRVLLQISQPDPVVSNIGARLLAEAYGFDQEDDQGPYQVYDFSGLPNAEIGGGCHGFMLAPVCGACFADTLCNTLGAQQQAATFLATGGDMIVGRRLTGSFLPCENPCP